MTTAKKHRRELTGEINPGGIYTTDLSTTLFGYGPEQLRIKIQAGEIPKPAPLSASARIGFWTGEQILQHRADMMALANPPTKATKVKKQKLRAPAKAMQSK